jgi:hypothetical protein
MPRLLLIVAISLLVPAFVQAEMIEVWSRLNSEGRLSITDVYGELSYDQGTSKFRVQLTNYTDPAVQLTNITGFLFNIAKDGFYARLDPNPTRSPDSVDAFYDVNGPEAATPYGNFEFGAAFEKNGSGDGDWLGGGNGTLGIANGQTGIFEFLVKDSSNQLAGTRLTTADFFSEYSTPTSGSIEPARFVVRVKSPTNFSEKVSIVPLPASAMGGLCLFGLLGIITGGRRLALCARSGLSATWAFVPR